MSGEFITLNVEGLNAITRSTRQFAGDLPEIVKEGTEEVSEFVVDKTRPFIAVRTGAAKSSLKASVSSAAGAQIISGGPKVPYYQWLDFGGNVGPNGSVKRPFIRGGRYVFYTFKRQRGEINRIIYRSIARQAKADKLDVEGDGA